jgi:hypothetical protein
VRRTICLHHATRGSFDGERHRFQRVAFWPFKFSAAQKEKGRHQGRSEGSIAQSERIAGVDHVGLGSDFDGRNFLPDGIDSAADLPKITQSLLDRGYNSDDIKKILGGNIIRVFREVERVGFEERDRRVGHSKIHQGKKACALLEVQIVSNRRRLSDLVPVVLNLSTPELSDECLLCSACCAVDLAEVEA